MKRILIIVLVLVLTLFSGCIITVSSSDAEKQTDIVMNAFKTGETEELKILFCKKIADSYDLDAQLNEAIAFIDGKIINDGHRIGMGETGSMYKDGVKVDSHISPYVEKIKTDKDNYYAISFFTYLIYADDEDCVGMTYLSVYKTDKKGDITEDEYTVGNVIWRSEAVESEA